MKITHLVFASTLVVSCNAWAELEVLQTGIQLAPAQKPAARGVGSVWRAMKDGQPYAITTISETNSSETFEDTDGCNRTRPKTFYSPSTHWANCGGNAGSATVRLNGEIFPLQVGKRWSFDVDGSDFDGGSWRTARDCEVQDAARVRTSLGENDTFKIVCTDNLNTRTGYYSPKLGTSVFLDHYRKKEAQHITYEFIKYERTE